MLANLAQPHHRLRPLAPLPRPAAFASFMSLSFADAVESRPSINAVAFHACAEKPVPLWAWGAPLLARQNSFAEPDLQGDR